jgi:CxxC motif-containing protein
MSEKRITCVICPNSCIINVTMENGIIKDLSGGRCKRGNDYASAECLNPVRTLTSTVRLKGAERALLPVKSSKPIPKGLLSECMAMINSASYEAPAEVGDIIVKNILGTGADIVSTGRATRSQLQ